MCHYSFDYLMEYLPMRYEASASQKEARYAVWNFKDGGFDSSIYDGLADKVESIVCGRESEYVICFIPASSRSKTIRRYQSLAEYLSIVTDVPATLSAISRSCDCESEHKTGKSVNPTADFCFDSSKFAGKKVILIDDVITRGRTFEDTADKLIARGAASVVGLFVAKTINPDYSYGRTYHAYNGNRAFVW